MQFVIFKNKGVLDEAFIRSFGVSVKNDSSCIGFFGTGLKYALAILVRSGARVVIYSGGQEFKFSKQRKELKGQTFEFVTMNGEMLSFTTELGKRWEPWMAYRELYSNALDEGGEVYLSDCVPNGSEGETYVVVGGGGIVALHNERDAIFCDTTAECAPGIYPTGGSFYSKGVCVWKYEDLPSLYSYNDSAGRCGLTEDRQIKYTYEVHRVAGALIVGLTDHEMLQRIVLADKNYYEGQLDYDYVNVSPGSLFMETVLRLKDDIKNESLLNYWRRHLPPKPLEEYELTVAQQRLFDEAVACVKQVGYMVTDYPIKHVLQLPENALGMARDGCIYISQNVYLQGGLAMLKATLIEEWVHLEYGYDDECYSMQNYLFGQIVRLADAYAEVCRDKLQEAA